MTDDDCTAIDGTNGWQQKLKYYEKMCPSAAWFTTNPHDLIWALTQAAAVGNR
jgi:hypothetical protein